MAEGLDTQAISSAAGGLVPVMGNTQLDEYNKRRAPVLKEPEPIVEGLAGYVRECWSAAKDHKEQYIEDRLLSNLRRRNGEYDPEVEQELQNQGGSQIWMHITATKCRAASAWLRDTLLGTGTEKPWTLSATPVPDLPPDIVEGIIAEATKQIEDFIQMNGQQPSDAQVRELLLEMKDSAAEQIKEESSKRAARMELKMEDQLVEGNWIQEFNKFIDDLCTFPYAVMKGPVVRSRPTMKWQQTANGGFEPLVITSPKLEWVRVSPFDIYWAPDASDIDDGYTIERHRLKRRDLNALIGVDGYDENNIRMVLKEHGEGGLKEWLANDSERAEIEGKGTDAFNGRSPEAIIDALEFHGMVQGSMLIEWGMKKSKIKDPEKDYNVSVWLIGSYVIKAQLNYDPLGRKPYFKTCFEKIPGQWCGNSIPDLAADVQDMANASARALANNMGISSGPQVAVNIDRLPDGEDITQMHPWKIWQTTNDPTGSSNSPAVTFFAPPSMAGELMGVYEKFATLADEYTGIPRYMQGDTNIGSAGRTASGISMLLGNASKIIKQVVQNVDVDVTQPSLEYQYYYNMKYGDDPDLKGDIRIQARGAISIIQKEAAQVRRNEFLQLALQSPMVGQIVGEQGIAEILRQVVHTLDMPNIDKIVPSPQALARKQLMQQQQMAAMQAALPPGTEGTPPQIGAPEGQQLQDGTPVTNNFAPMQGV